MFRVAHKECDFNVDLNLFRYEDQSVEFELSPHFFNSVLANLGKKKASKHLNEFPTVFSEVSSFVGILQCTMYSTFT